MALSNDLRQRLVALHQPDPPRVAVLPFDPDEEVAQRRLVRGVAGQDLISQQKPSGVITSPITTCAQSGR
jgi:hypothetical protein